MTAISGPEGQDSRFSYDAAGRLTELASPEADQSYSYGPSGRRVGAKTSTEETGGKLDYLWDPSFSLGQIAEISGSQKRSFAYGRGRIAQTGPGGSSYLHIDNLGSVVATSDQRGQRSSRTTYNPYGSPARTKGKPKQSSFAYTGQLREEGTGRYHLRARLQSRDGRLPDARSDLAGAGRAGALALLLRRG
jgi:YD repeat-containing protein